MKIAVIGANGQLGTDLVAACLEKQWDVVGLTHGDINVEDEVSVRTVLAAIRPAAVLNTAAFHHVPRCEQDPARAFSVNAVGALNVARSAQELGSTVVYYSTDYVFDGEKRSAYTEADLPRPVNVYGATKLAGEHLTLTYAERSLVLRISGIYGRVPCRAKGGNFVTTMINAARNTPEVRVVDDEILSPTPTRLIASRTAELLEGDVRGVLHLASGGSCSWYEFARVIFETMNVATPLIPCPSSEFPSAVRRPAFSAMESSRLAACPVTPMPSWRECVVNFLLAEYR
jgi:dTDP-4-dehydrorhamnose reductase